MEETSTITWTGTTHNIPHLSLVTTRPSTDSPHSQVPTGNIFTSDRRPTPRRYYFRSSQLLHVHVRRLEVTRLPAHRDVTM